MSKAMEKLLSDWDGGAMTGLELAERAHAIGYREGRKSRGKVVARGWMVPDSFTGFRLSPHSYGRESFPVEVVAKEVERGD